MPSATLLYYLSSTRTRLRAVSRSETSYMCHTSEVLEFSRIKHSTLPHSRVKSTVSYSISSKPPRTPENAIARVRHSYTTYYLDHVTFATSLFHPRTRTLPRTYSPGQIAYSEISKSNSLPRGEVQPVTSLSPGFLNALGESIRFSHTHNYISLPGVSGQVHNHYYPFQVPENAQEHADERFHLVRDAWSEKPA